jgi:hypothetical protein
VSAIHQIQPIKPTIHALKIKHNQCTVFFLHVTALPECHHQEILGLKKWERNGALIVLNF